ncbi:MAG: GGDEF domain-containing protein [Sphingomonas sp.]
MPGIAALPGAWIIALDRGLPVSDGFRIWYTAHAVSICVMAPLVLRLRAHQLTELLDRKRLLEAIGWLAAFVAAGCAVFAQDDVLPLFLLMPLLVIILFRAGFVGLTVGIGLLALLATLTISTNSGPFVTMAPGAQWWNASSLAQLFILLVFGTMVLIAALLDERRAREEALERLNAELSVLVGTDPLTGVPNRRSYDDAIAASWHAARLKPSSLALLVIDIDRFKQYNDRYGHAAGDDCLRQVAAALRDELRSMDSLCARYGGEEFVIILPRATADEALVIGDRLCSAVRDLGLAHADSRSGIVTVSIGAAATVPRGGGGREPVQAQRRGALSCQDARPRSRRVRLMPAKVAVSAPLWTRSRSD